MKVSGLNVKVCAIILVFDHKKEFLKTIIERLETLGVYEIIIVNNGQKRLDDKNHKIIHSSRNMGPAGGFRLGMKEALNSQSDFIWLLDEDNLPEESSLEEIVKAWERLSGSVPKEDLILYSYRPQLFKNLHPHQVKGITSIGPRRNSFLGFHYKQLIQYIRTRLSTQGVKKHHSLVQQQVIEMNTGYFGGLFMHIDLVKHGLLPESDAPIYWSDMAYTRQLHLNGARIFMVPPSVISDMDHKELSAQKRHFLHHPTLDLSPAFKAYHYAYGLMRFENMVREGRPISYLINKAIMLSLIGIMAKMRGKSERLQVISSAMASVKRDQVNKQKKLNKEEA